MDNITKSKELRKLLQKELLPLVNNDYVLWGLPYYKNIGDLLIWEGMEQLFDELSFKCIDRANSGDYYQPELNEDIVILIAGGGYFGDTWRAAFNYLLKGISKYKKNKIILLPNTVHYQDNELMKSDAKYLAEFDNLIVCTRDSVSYKTATENFSNKVLLLPDMAFGINPERLKKYIVSETDRTLYLKRTDHEMGKNITSIENDENVDVKDWPHLTMDIRRFFFEGLGFGHRIFLSKLPIISKASRTILNYMAFNYHKPETIKLGVRFLSQYKDIYTTRLHTMILAILLNKDVTFLDNSYGKNSSLYNTWLKDVDTVKELK